MHNLVARPDPEVLVSTRDAHPRPPSRPSELDILWYLALNS